MQLYGVIREKTAVIRYQIVALIFMIILCDTVALGIVLTMAIGTSSTHFSTFKISWNYKNWDFFRWNFPHKEIHKSFLLRFFNADSSVVCPIFLSFLFSFFSFSHNLSSHFSCGSFRFSKNKLFFLPCIFSFYPLSKAILSAMVRKQRSLRKLLLPRNCLRKTFEYNSSNAIVISFWKEIWTYIWTFLDLLDSNQFSYGCSWDDVYYWHQQKVFMLLKNQNESRFLNLRKWGIMKTANLSAPFISFLFFYATKNIFWKTMFKKIF